MYKSITIKNVMISFGPWVTPMWLNTIYGPQIQLGWIVIAISNGKMLED